MKFTYNGREAVYSDLNGASALVRPGDVFDLPEAPDAFWEPVQTKSAPVEATLDPESEIA